MALEPRLKANSPTVLTPFQENNNMGLEEDFKETADWVRENAMPATNDEKLQCYGYVEPESCLLPLCCRVGLSRKQ